jgi:sigma-E factor negative regulatory protein RseB
VSVVAGRSAKVIEARRAGHLAARLWVDEVSGLLLRMEVLDREGRLTRMAVFVDVSVSAPQGALSEESMAEGWMSPGAAAAPSTWSTSSVSSATWSLALREQVRDAGYPCPDTLPAGMRLVDVRWSTRGAPDAVHLTYTDGLSGMSVFVQPGSLDAAGLRAGSSGGWMKREWDGVEVVVAAEPPARVVWSSAGHVVTLVADGSREPLRDVVSAFADASPDEGLRADLSGMARDLFGLLPGR